MKIELDNKQIDEVTRKTIESMEKEIKSLTNKLDKRDSTIIKLRGGMDISAKRRQKIRELVASLVVELEEAQWVDIDKYYEE